MDQPSETSIKNHIECYVKTRGVCGSRATQDIVHIAEFTFSGHESEQLASDREQSRITEDITS